MILSLETEPIADAANELRRVYSALRSRHGSAFRALDARLDALPDLNPPMQVHTLDDETVVIGPPQEWLDILAEARRLGVI